MQAGDSFVRFGIPGQPDIQGVVYGHWVGIETKSKDGTVSPEQNKFRDRVHKADGFYAVARDWATVRDFLLNNFPLTIPDTL